MSSALTTFAAMILRNDYLPRLDEDGWAVIAVEDFGPYEHGDVTVSNTDGSLWILGIMEGTCYRILVPTGEEHKPYLYLPTDELTEAERNQLFFFAQGGEAL